MAKRKNRVSATPAPSLTAKIEQQERAALLQSARSKIASGSTADLTAREKRAVKEYELERRREYGVQYLRSMPKGDFLELFGGSSKVNIQWRDEYGFPWPDRKVPDVDVAVILEWYRTQFINGGPVGDETAEDVLLRGASQSLKDEFVREKIRGERITNQQKAIDLETAKASYMPTELIIESHNELAERIRKTRERLARHFDGDTRERIELAFDGLIEDYIRDVEVKFGVAD